jgi:hypothetical protein
MRNALRILVSSAASMVVFGAAFAAPLVIDLKTFVTGDNGGNVSVAKLTLTQNGANVDFRLDNSVANHSGSNTTTFLTMLEFSYDGSPVLTSGSFTSFGGTQSVGAADFGINPQGQNAGYDFYLDLDYPNSKNQDRFVDGEYSTWTITGVNVSDFSVPVAGSGPASLAMVHVQGLNDGGSAKYVGSGDGSGPPVGNPVPEPGTLLLAGGALAIALLARRRT